MMNESKKIAEYLLQIKAIKLNPANPFTWASGWKSPIYCDNRQALSFPEIRDYIRDTFKKTIENNFTDVDVVAGVATGAIAYGALVAQALNLPFVYVRASEKKHGMGNRIEGHIKEGQKVVVIEDLVSTGGSSLKAVAALRNAKCNVVGMTAIFTYGFQQSVDAFEKAECTLVSLSNYNDLIELAFEKAYINNIQVAALKEWRKNPEKWRK